jgi:hypothetical protein
MACMACMVCVIERAPLHINLNRISAQDKVGEPVFDDRQILEALWIEPSVANGLNHIGAEFEFGQRPKPAPDAALRTTLKPDG